VKGVDRHRHPCESSRDPTDESGLGRVGVYDVGSEVSYRPIEAPENPQIGQRSDLAPQPMHADTLHAVLPREIVEVPFPLPFVSDKQASLIAASGQARRQHDHVDRWSANVQSGEETEHAHLSTGQRLGQIADSRRYSAAKQ